MPGDAAALRLLRRCRYCGGRCLAWWIPHRQPSEVRARPRGLTGWRRAWAYFVGVNPDPSVTVVVTPDDLDGGWVAEIVELPGWVSEGETVAEALRNIADAYEGVSEP